MKQIKTKIAAILLIAAFSSCKKNQDDVVTPVATGPKLAKIEYPGSSITQTFTYNASGRLVKSNDGYFVLNYNISPWGYEAFNPANVKEYDITNAVLSSGKLTQYDYRGFNSSGAISSSEINTIHYDANGCQVKKTYGDYEYNYTVSGGNTVSYTEKKISTGVINSTVTIEYYTDKANKFNLNLFEHWCQDQILNDMDMFGKKNTNLVKKVTETRATSNTVSEFTYVLNAEGLPTQWTQTYTANGGTPSVSVANATWQ